MAAAGLGGICHQKPLKVSFLLLNEEEEDVWVGRGRGEGKEREGGRQAQLQRTKSVGRKLRQEEFSLKTQEMRGSRRLPGAGKRAEIQNGNLPKQRLGWLLRHENMGRNIKRTQTTNLGGCFLGGCGKPLRTFFFFFF